MKVLRSGHLYELAHLDGSPVAGCVAPKVERLAFVDRGHGNDLPGTNNQEVLRVLINRVQFLDNERHWEGNARIIAHLRMALVLHESRHLEQAVMKLALYPERVAVNNDDGHFTLTPGELPSS